MKRIAFALLLVVAFTSVRSAARPSPCARKQTVPFSEITKELDNLVSGICASPTAACLQTNVEIYPIQNAPPLKQFTAFWTQESAQPPVFDIAAQNKLVADAKNVAKQYQPKCSDGKAKYVSRYEFRTSTVGTHYWISVRLTYACCSGALPTPQGWIPVPTTTT